MGVKLLSSFFDWCSRCHGVGEVLRPLAAGSNGSYRRNKIGGLHEWNLLIATREGSEKVQAKLEGTNLLLKESLEGKAYLLDGIRIRFTRLFNLFSVFVYDKKYVIRTVLLLIWRKPTVFCTRKTYVSHYS